MGGDDVGSVEAPIGRSHDVAAVRRALDAADVVIVHGVAGIGKSTVVAAALADARPVWIRCAPALALRPYGAVVGVAGGPPPDANPAQIGRWIIERVPSGVLVVDDLQFADHGTLSLVAAVAGELTCVVVVRSNGRRVTESLAAVFEGRAIATVPIGPLSPCAAEQLAVRHGADGASAAAIAAHTGGHPFWIVHEARDEHGPSAARAIAAALDRAAAATRTAVVALALLGRPVGSQLLGPGVEDAIRDGLVGQVPGSRTVELAHGLVGEVALARVTPEDRRAMHLALASRLRSPLERARHFVAGDDVDHAITAARSAIGTDPRSLEALALLAELTGDDVDRVRLAEAALVVGRYDLVLRMATEVDIGSPHRSRIAVAAATSARCLGLDPTVWLATAEVATATLDPGHPNRRALAIEQFLVAVPSERMSGDELISLCDGTPDEPMARVAVAIAGITGHDTAWETKLHDAIASAERAEHAAALTAGLWAYMTAAVSGGAIASAIELARHGATRADELGEELWAGRFRAEQAWCAAIGTTDPPDESPAGAIALRLGDCGEIGAARRLLASRRGSWRDTAVALALDWYDDVCDPSAAGDILRASSDAIVTWIAGPVAAWTRDLTDDVPPIIRQEAAAVAALDGDDPTDGIDLFIDVARGWAATAPRGHARAAWAAASGAGNVGDPRAAELVEQAIEVVERTGIHALDHRLADVARRAGVPYDRGRASVRNVTPREAEVLQCVAEGLSTARIARRLGIAPTTVATHLRSAATKLGAANRREAAAIMARDRATAP